MLDNYIITIARGFGSGGREVAFALSNKLGIPCYSSQILKMASDYSGINEKFFVKNDEKLTGLRLLMKLGSVPNTDRIVEPYDKKFTSDNNIFSIQKKIIRELAKTQSCVIIGKCSNYILRDCDNVCSVYIEAPRKACVERLKDYLGVDENEAASAIVRTDKYRSDYYKYYTGGHSWTNPTEYDMTLNSDRIGIEHCADIIINYLKLKGKIL
ncbi:MAG: AAA family ATPase [Ruminococcus sp.]